jgi:hypothetical protein
MKILQDLPEEREKLLEEESQITEPESLPEPSQTSRSQTAEKGENSNFGFYT